MNLPSLKEIEWKRRYSFEVGNPVLDFYVPALSRSVRYDRKAGFFSSTALSVVAQGVARLIQNDGRMRLLVGCCLSKADVEAIQKGYALKSAVEERFLSEIHEPLDAIQKGRLEALAWMIAKGYLEIRVAVPKDEAGNPVPSTEHEGIFHEKVGIFTDAHGNKIAFSGSINETESGWLKNRESFHVYCSWRPDGEHIRDEEEEFELLWENRGKRTLVVDFPDAVKERLIDFVPAEKPVKDPLEPEEETFDAIDELKERIRFQFIKDAPFLENALDLPFVTSTVRPWPHQTRVVRSVVSRFPDRFLLCDEVGLGKTIEAGVAIRSLMMSGIVKRCLLLVPGGIVQQWREELREKFNLYPYYYNGDSFEIHFGNDEIGKPMVEKYPANDANPWNTFNFIIASSHLAKRRERQHELLSAKDWDMILIDEAHHARRIAPTSDRYRPNNLLTLLHSLESKTKGLLLLTATPMQLSPVELWDLLLTLGLGGRWAQSGETFADYFRELRQLPSESADLNFLLDLVNDYFRHGGTEDSTLREKVQNDIGIVWWQRFFRALSSTHTRSQLYSLSEKQSAYLYHFLRCHTPLRSFLHRNTRELLRTYIKRGMLHENIAKRKVFDRFIPMSAEEQLLYDDIEEYLREFYHKAVEGNQQGLGFIMTIYRRRLTSSIYAITESLRRRQKALEEEQLAPYAFLTPEDWDEWDLSEDLYEEMVSDTSEPEESIQVEMAYLKDFIERLERVGQDSKFIQLVADLSELLKIHAKVIIFTQYTDTMDYLRAELQPVYQRHLACYSGRGGECFHDGQWRSATKDEIKNRFLAPDDIKILLCTDAASEGLNLQSCGLLINYDIPWNPMRVEQRIGRIDRIGQVFGEVTILNYFYEGTVEAEIYRRLSERINWFQTVVGGLAPILAQLPHAVEEAAMTSPQQRNSVIKALVDKINAQLEQQKNEALVLEEYLAQELDEIPSKDLGGRGDLDAPLSQTDIAVAFTTSSMMKKQGIFIPVTNGIYELKWQGASFSVTFEPDVYDAHPDTVRYLSYGDPLFDELLNAFAGEASATFSAEWTEHKIYRVVAERHGYKRIRYLATTNDATDSIREIRNFDELKEHLSKTDDEEDIPRETVSDYIDAVRTQLEKQIVAKSDAQIKRIELQTKGRLAATQAQIRELLTEYLIIDLAKAIQDGEYRLESTQIDATNLLQSKLIKGEQPYTALSIARNYEGEDLMLDAQPIQNWAERKAEAIAQHIGVLKQRAKRKLEDYKANMAPKIIFH